MSNVFNNGSHDGMPPSKSQLKRDMDALQNIGRALTELPAAKLKKMALDEGLLAAVLDYQRFTANGAKRRQLQYIGKLMRDIDPEPIEQQLAALRGDSSAPHPLAAPGRTLARTPAGRRQERTDLYRRLPVR